MFYSLSEDIGTIDSWEEMKELPDVVSAVRHGTIISQV